MKLWVVLCAFIIGLLHEIDGRPASTDDSNPTAVKAPTSTAVAPAATYDSIAFDEIVVESNLNVRKKPEPARRRPQRSANVPLTDERIQRHHRQFNSGFGDLQQRQPNFGLSPATFGGKFPAQPNYGSSASSANANSQSQKFGPQGFGSAAAQAQAQGFQAQGPLGGFGASAANTGTQSFQAGPNGIRGSAGQSASQVYQLPNGHSVNLALTNGFSVGPDGRPATSNANSITYT